MIQAHFIATDFVMLCYARGQIAEALIKLDPNPIERCGTGLLQSL